MKHAIIGTAGHIDHGKTTLIMSLTGRNTDRLKEEQQRGISIDLGFTYFDLPSGIRAGIIDVPGHEKFIRNMLAGVPGMDLILFVIAADEGVMPQTREHLAILDLLGIKKGFVVLTKCDMVDEDWLDLVEEEIKDFSKNSFLGGQKIIRASSVNKQGIGQVKEEIDRLISEIKMEDQDPLPRLLVDRSFTITGIGTVVTGTLLSGIIQLGDDLQIYPTDKIGRVRGLQVHDQPVKEAEPRQRVAINLAGIKKSEVERGDVLAPPNTMQSTMMLDARVQTIDLPLEIQNRTRFHLYLGTKELLCRMVILDKEILNGNDSALVQLRLEEPIVARKNDRFILRAYSPVNTIGGGMVLDPNPKKKKRLQEHTITRLETIETSQPKEQTYQHIADHSHLFLSMAEIAKRQSAARETITTHVRELLEDGRIVLFSQPKEEAITSFNFYEKSKGIIVKEINDYHRQFPLRPGVKKETIRSKFFPGLKSKLFDQVVEQMTAEGAFTIQKDILQAVDFTVVYNADQQRIKDVHYQYYQDGGSLPVNSHELFPDFKKRETDIIEVENALVASGEFVKLDAELIVKIHQLEKLIQELKTYLITHPSITISEYRDLIHSNRKIAIALLEYTDTIKVTKRQGDKRILHS